VAACSLMLAVMLMVGAGGYGCIHGLSSSSTTTAKLATLEQLSREADQDRIVTPASIALAITTVSLVAMAARAANPSRYLVE
jgi:hypothetical protein